MDVCTTMMQERKQLERVLENQNIQTKEDAIAYAEALTKIIWNHQMLGSLHEYYDENIVYKGANGKKITNVEEVILEFLGMISAFPDMRVHICESFVSGDLQESFVVYQRSYCEGTNTGTSKYGPPTGNKLNEKNSFGQTVYVFHKAQNKWKVVNEYSLRSEPTIKKLLKNEL